MVSPVSGGAFHLFEAYAPDSGLTRRTARHWMTALHSALRHAHSAGVL
jgi:hypothetical protein